MHSVHQKLTGQLKEQYETLKPHGKLKKMKS